MRAETEPARCRRMSAVSTLASAAALLRRYRQPELARQVSEVAKRIETDRTFYEPARGPSTPL